MVGENFEDALVNFLVDLKKRVKLLAVKADFEAEGVSEQDLVFLSRVVFKAGLQLAVKIGGCEAISNLESGKKFGANLIIAPMIESSFAMKKFVNAANRVYGNMSSDKVQFAINAETLSCRENFNEILKQGRKFLNVVNVGRVDLANCIGVGRNGVNSEEVFEHVEFFLKSAKKEGLATGFGGGLSAESVQFIKNLKGLADRFETRKLIFGYEFDEEILKYCISKADEFEILCLKNRRQTFLKIAEQNDDRMKIISDRFMLN